MGICCGKTPQVDVHCPYRGLSVAFLRLPLKVGDPPPSGSTPGSSLLEEYNAKWRVGVKLARDLGEAVDTLLSGYRDEARMIRAFNQRPQLAQNLFANLCDKVRKLYFIYQLAESAGDFILLDCKGEMVKQNLDFEYWRCRELVGVVARILVLGVQFSIIRHRHGAQMLQDLSFFRTYLESCAVPVDLIDLLNFTGQVEGEEPATPQERQRGFFQAVVALCGFLQTADPILSVIAQRLGSLEGQRAAALLEGMAWLGLKTVKRYQGRYNAQIANAAKVGVASVNILRRAGLEGPTRNAITEKWRRWLQATKNSNNMALLQVRQMETTSEQEKEKEIFVLENGQPIGSPFLDLSQQLLKSVPSYSQAEVLDPYRFEERLTVKLKHLPKRPTTLRDPRRSADMEEESQEEQNKNWEFLKFPEDMSRGDFRYLLAFLLRRLDDLFLY